MVPSVYGLAKPEWQHTTICCNSLQHSIQTEAKGFINDQKGTALW